MNKKHEDIDQCKQPKVIYIDIDTSESEDSKHEKIFNQANKLIEISPMNVMMPTRNLDFGDDREKNKFSISNAINESFCKNPIFGTQDYDPNTRFASILCNRSIKIRKVNANLKICSKQSVEVEQKKPRLQDSAEKTYNQLQDKIYENGKNDCRYNHERTNQETSQNSTNLVNKTQDNIILNEKNSVAKEITQKTNSICCQTEKNPLLSVINIKDNEKAIEFYTGLQNYEKFLHVFNTLGNDAFDLRYYYCDKDINLSHVDQFFMTLILLRQHKSHYEISILFDITLKDIKNIFITWIRFMKLEWGNIKLPLSYKPTEQLLNSQSENAKLEKEYSVTKFCKENNEVVNLEDNIRNLDKTKSFKKVYKILNGPQNYIESHLMNDIIFVCHVLCYFKARRISDKESVK